MTAIDGKLLSYELNAKSKRINPYDMHHTRWDLENIFTSPQVLYSFELNGLKYQSARLSLLGAVDMNHLNEYISPKPITVTVNVNPDNPNDATLHLGQFSRPKLFRASLTSVIFVSLLFKYVGF